MPVRFDRHQMRKPVKHDAGFVRVDAFIARVGIQEYQMGDGSTRRELRPPEEVFHKDALESFAGVPVTDRHPPKLISAKDAKKFSVGAVGDVVTPEDTMVRASLAIHHADAIDAVFAKRRQEISCGYSCEIDETPGVWNGQKYDAIQRKIRGNHVALVESGRAGKDVKVNLDRMDAADGESFQADEDPEEPPTTSGNREDDDNERKTPMPKVRLDGIDFEASEQLVQAISTAQQKREDEKKELTESLKVLKTESEKLQGKLDAKAEEAKELQKKLDAATDPKAIAATVAERVALETTAKGVLGSKEKLDGLTIQDIKLKVLGKLRPKVKFDGKPEAYIDGAFESAIESKAKGSVDDARRASHHDADDDDVDDDDRHDTDDRLPAWMQKADSKKAREKMLNRFDHAHATGSTEEPKN